MPSVITGDSGSGSQSVSSAGVDGSGDSLAAVSTVPPSGSSAVATSSVTVTVEDGSIGSGEVASVSSSEPHAERTSVPTATAASTAVRPEVECGEYVIASIVGLEKHFPQKLHRPSLSPEKCGGP